MCLCSWPPEGYASSSHKAGRHWWPDTTLFTPLLLSCNQVGSVHKLTLKFYCQPLKNDGSTFANRGEPNNKYCLWHKHSLKKIIEKSNCYRIKLEKGNWLMDLFFSNFFKKNFYFNFNSLAGKLYLLNRKVKLSFDSIICRGNLLKLEDQCQQRGHISKVIWIHSLFHGKNIDYYKIERYTSTPKLCWKREAKIDINHLNFAAATLKKENDLDSIVCHCGHPISLLW